MVTVETIRIYPVKALRGYALPASDVAIWGLDHDRRWMVVTPDGRFLTQRELPAMACISAHTTGDALTLAADDGDGLRLEVPAPEGERGGRAAAGSGLERSGSGARRRA